MGGGHAHVQVLRRFAMNPPENARVLVVFDTPVAVYSGMVPGYVAGQYTRHELEIDVVPLARRAGAGLVFERATGIDPDRREIHFDDRPPLRFDLASIDIGSTIRGLESPGVRDEALTTRPIGRFVRELDRRLDRLEQLGQRARVHIVGGGAAGCEIAFALESRLRARAIPAEISIVASESAPMAHASRSFRRAVAHELTARRIGFIGGTQAVGVSANELALDGGQPATRSDLVVWATGAAPTLFDLSGDPRLTRDASGFIATRDTLQTVDHDDIFAVGDCARLVDHPWIPRAGVYAVRQGPILEANLRARLAGHRLRRYRPQRDFLALLNLGDGRALGGKWGLALRGHLVFRLKDAIDRRFMDRFQMLDADGHPRPGQAHLGQMGGQAGAAHDQGTNEEMPCGGCAAKLGAAPLEAALGRLPAPLADPSVEMGLEARDDIAATRTASGEVLLHNIDVIRAFADDPYLCGRIAAINATSDIHAKGGRARYAQATVTLPEGPPAAGEETLYQVLSGIRSVLDGMGTTLLGGHTTSGEALAVGLAVLGEPGGDTPLLGRSGARAGDRLWLTQPLGTGVILAADMRGLARGPWVAEAYRTMAHANDRAGAIASRRSIHASTDVTGFGLAGHLLDLLEADDLVAEIDGHAIPFLPGARTLFESGHRSTAHPANLAAFETRIENATEFDLGWLLDPQTAGGLLLACAPEDSSEIEAIFAKEGEPPIHEIGSIRARDPSIDRSSMRGSIRLDRD